MKKITPFLWFDGRAEEAMKFYTSIFKDSKAGKIRYYGKGGPAPDGSVMSASFEINGQEFIAFNGGPMFSFTPAISLFVNCISQEEVDEYWEKLSEGGQKQRCGWLLDKFGLSWQIVPEILGQLLEDKDPEKAKNVMNAMMQMDKLDIAKLKQASQTVSKNGDGKTSVTVENTISAPVDKVWKYWNGTEHITKWCQASDDWFAPHAENDAQTGGKFKTVMSAKDGSYSFDFEGVYTSVRPLQSIEYDMTDGRKVKISFIDQGGSTQVIETFDAEDSNPVEMQKTGWQAILDSFKKYVESN